MIIKMMITFDFDPETNEYTPIDQKIIEEKPKKVTIVEEAEDSGEPQLTLEPNKYTLNKSAISLLQVEAGDRIDIRFQPIDGGKILYPIIGSSDTWKTNTGNKLTKSNTVSFRGKGNQLLADYGDTFTITPWQGHEGLFVLVGNKDREEDNNIVITEPSEPEEDLVAPYVEDLEDAENQLLEDSEEDADTDIDDMTFEL